MAGFVDDVVAAADALACTMRLLWQLLVAVFSVLWRAVVVVTPLLGAWLASSLAAHFGGPRELALGVAVLLFPIVPLSWEAFGARRFAKKIALAKEKGREAPTTTLKTVDRIVLRTLVVNGAFIGVLLGLWPSTAFTALATRGDWFVDGVDAEWAEPVRATTTFCARGLEWLHKLANDNPNEKAGDDVVPDDLVPVDDDVPDPTRDPKVPDPKVPDPVPVPVDPKQPVPVTDDVVWTVGKTTWPRPNELHPAVKAITAVDEASIQSVGAYFTAHVADPFERTKALHDWVVDRLHYDLDSLVEGQRKPQDAETVFRLRMGVCEGYARLLVALGAAAGVNVVYVVGDVRERDGRAALVGHAWNGVQIDGNWYLIDATWNDPVGDTNTYRTDYLFIPPSVAVLDHYPDDNRWQLLKTPVTRAAFLRQPATGPGFARNGLSLVKPQRPTIDAQGSVDVVIDNPRRLWLSVTIGPGGEDGGADTRCLPAGTSDPDAGWAQPAQLTVSCPAPRGRSDIAIFAGKAHYGTYDWVGGVAVNGR